MSADVFNIEAATKEQLQEWLEDLRERRKKGYEMPSVKTSKKKQLDLFGDLSPEIAEKILQDMMKGDGE